MIIIGGLPWNCKSTSTLASRLEKYLIRTKSGKITGYCVFPACQWFTSRDLRSFQNYDSEITAYPFLRSWEYYTVHLLSIIRCAINKMLEKSPWTVLKFFFEHFHHLRTRPMFSIMTKSHFPCCVSTDYFMEMPYNPPGCRNRTLGTLFQGRKSNLPTFIMGGEPIEALHTKSDIFQSSFSWWGTN